MAEKIKDLQDNNGIEAIIRGVLRSGGSPLGKTGEMDNGHTVWHLPGIDVETEAGEARRIKIFFTYHQNPGSDSLEVKVVNVEVVNPEF